MKKGMSNTLATVLIVLMAIIAIVMIWLYLRSSIVESSERISMEERCYALAAELQSCEYASLGEKHFVTGLVKLTQGDSTPLKIVFYTKNGTAATRELEPIKIFETKKVLPATRMTEEPYYAIISPIVYNEAKTKTIVCPFSKKIFCNKITIPGNLCEIPTFIEDINPFVLAISNPEKYNLTYPDCPIINTDFDCDNVYGGTQGFGDINHFITVLSNGWILCNRSMICEHAGQNWMDNQTAINYFNKTLCV